MLKTQKRPRVSAGSGTTVRVGLLYPDINDTRIETQTETQATRATNGIRNDIVARNCY